MYQMNPIVNMTATQLIEKTQLPDHGLLEKEKLTNPKLAETTEKLPEERESGSESEGEYLTNEENISKPAAEQEEDEEDEQEEFIQYTLYDKDVDAFREFEDNMNKAIGSGPYLKAGKCGIIREFPDPYRILKKPRTEVQIHSIVASETSGFDHSFRSKLLADEEENNNNSPMDPRFTDYMEDREIETSGSGGSPSIFPRHSDDTGWRQGIGTLIPMIPRGERNHPLSYQRAVFEQEDQDSTEIQTTIYDQETGAFRTDIPASSHTESLICEKSEGGSVLDHRIEPIPSSLRRTVFEQGLINPHLRDGSEFTTDENRLRRMRTMKTEESSREDSKKTYTPSFITSIKEKYSEAIRDDEEVGLLKQNLTFGCFIQALILIFLSLATMIGLFIQVGAGCLVPLVFSVQCLFMTTYSRLSREYENYKIKRNERRKRLGSRFGKINADRHPVSPIHMGFGPTPHFKDKVNPLDGMRLLKPDGPAGWLPRHVRKLHIEKVRISEARVEVTDQRPHLQITLPDGTVKSALFDTGSTSCGIHPRVLAELEKTVSIPKERRNFDLKGVIPDVSASIDEVAYITIKLPVTIN